jgi:RecB family exonuclease
VCAARQSPARTAREPAPVSPPAATAGAAAQPASDARADGARERRELLAPLDEDVGSLSYTALAELRRCAYRFYLERVLGLDERRAGGHVRGGGGEGLDARARGAIVHRLLESASFARPAQPAGADAAAAARELGLRAGRAECEEMARLAGAATRESPPGGPAARLAAAAQLRREHPFAFSLAATEPLFTGVIDVLARERDGGALVVDYKTDRVPPGVRLDELVERDYGLQRLIYALAALRAGAPAVEIVHWYLERPREWISVRYEAADRVRLEAQLEGELARARARGYAVSDDPHRALCETCPGRGGLCSYSDAEAMRESPREGAAEARS